PAIGRGAVDPSGRSHKTGMLAPGGGAANATSVPSGDTVIWYGLRVSGASIRNRTSRSAAGRVPYRIAAIAVASHRIAIAATVRHASRSRDVLIGGPSCA